MDFNREKTVRELQRQLNSVSLLIAQAKDNCSERGKETSVHVDLSAAKDLLEKAITKALLLRMEPL